MAVHKIKIVFWVLNTNIKKFIHLYVLYVLLLYMVNLMAYRWYLNWGKISCRIQCKKKYIFKERPALLNSSTV